MAYRRFVILVSCVVLGSVFPAADALARKRAIDVEHSTIKIRVYRAGFFSAFGHEHEVLAPIEAGSVEESENASIEFRIGAAKLKVLDPGASEADRAAVQKKMETEVLDVAHFPEIRFQSSAVESKGSGRWDVRGNLTLHGTTQPVLVEVTEFPSEYRGAVLIRQSDFGITPISIGGGAVKVKNEVKIEFAIVLAPVAGTP